MENTESVRRAAEAMTYRAVRQHQGVGAVSSATVSWAKRFRLAVSEAEVARASAIRVGELAAYAFSREPPDVVQLGADLVTWLFLFDDAVGEASDGISERAHREELFEYEAVIRGGQLPPCASGFHVSLLHWTERAVALGATADWVDRFADDMADYFDGCARETPYRRNGLTPPVAEYRLLRRQTVGTSPVFAVIELGRSGVVARAEMLTPLVREARGVAALLTAWVNDVYSFPKERAAKDPLNLVAAIAAERGLEVPQALGRAVRVYNDDLATLERLIARAKAQEPSPALAGYLSGLVDWVHGNRIWTQSCGRYA